MPCYRSLSHNSLSLTFDLSNTNRTGASVCVLPCGLTQTDASHCLLSPWWCWCVWYSPLVLPHVSHRYLIVRRPTALRDAKMSEWKQKTSLQTALPSNNRHLGLAHGFFTLGSNQHLITCPLTLNSHVKQTSAEHQSLSLLSVKELFAFSVKHCLHW